MLAPKRSGVNRHKPDILSRSYARRRRHCKTLEPGVVAVIQPFRDRINFHPHLHFLVTEGGVDEAGVFHKLGFFDGGRLVEVFVGRCWDFLSERSG